MLEEGHIGQTFFMEMLEVFGGIAAFIIVIGIVIYCLNVVCTPGGKPDLNKYLLRRDYLAGLSCRSENQIKELLGVILYGMLVLLKNGSNIDEDSAILHSSLQSLTSNDRKSFIFLWQSIRIVITKISVNRQGIIITWDSLNDFLYPREVVDPLSVELRPFVEVLTQNIQLLNQLEMVSLESGHQLQLDELSLESGHQLQLDDETQSSEFEMVPV